VPVSQEHILAEIRRTAEANGGEALGHRAFQSETGIRPADWGRYWPRWGDAVEEAGYSRKALNARLSDDEILAPLVPVIRSLGRFPTEPELTVMRRKGVPVPSVKVFRRYGGKQALIERTLSYCREQPGMEDVVAILEPLVTDEPAPPEEESETAAVEDFGYVYLIKSGKHYKIGRSNAVGRRERELAIQLPERATTVHTITTDDPPGIEAYWHRRFAERRANGEWFSLTAADVTAFKRRKFM
jgi:hypothetical protein